MAKICLTGRSDCSVTELQSRIWTESLMMDCWNFIWRSNGALMKLVNARVQSFLFENQANQKALGLKTEFISLGKHKREIEQLNSWHRPNFYSNWVTQCTRWITPARAEGCLAKRIWLQMTQRGEGAVRARWSKDDRANSLGGKTTKGPLVKVFFKGWRMRVDSANPHISG